MPCCLRLQLLTELLEHDYPNTEAIARALGVPLTAVRVKSIVSQYMAAQDAAAYAALEQLISSSAPSLVIDLKRTLAISLFDVARRRLAQSLQHIQTVDRFRQVSEHRALVCACYASFVMTPAVPCIRLWDASDRIPTLKLLISVCTASLTSR